MILDHTFSEAVHAKIVKVDLALSEVQYTVECHLRAGTTCTTVKLLDFADGAGDALSFTVKPSHVPADVVITQTKLANQKFLPKQTPQETHLDRKLQINQKTGDFLIKSIETSASRDIDAKNVLELAALMETKVAGLLDERAKLLEQMKEAETSSQKLEKNSLFVQVFHNKAGGRVQFTVKCTGRNIKAHLCSEYRYSSLSGAGSFQQFFQYQSPLKEAIETNVDVFMTFKVPAFTVPKLDKAFVRLSGGQVQLKNLKLGEPSCTPRHDPICQLQAFKLIPGSNILPILTSTDPLRVRFEAIPEVEPGKVYAMGEVFNEWSHVIDSAQVDVYRDDIFCHSHKLPSMMPGKKTWIPCGLEPPVAVELTTKTERGSKPVTGSTSQVSFLNVQHTAKVTTTTASKESPICVRVKLQMPKGSYHLGAKPSILPLGEYKYEQSEDFVDPPEAPTVHLVKDTGAAILRIATGEAASFSYRIEWRDNLVTTGGFGPAPESFGAPVGGLFGDAPAFGGGHTFGAPPFGGPAENPAGEIQQAAAQQQAKNSLFGAPAPEAFAAAPPFVEGGRSFEEARAAEFGYTPPQQQASHTVGEVEGANQQQEDANTDGSWVEAGSLPTQKQYASSKMPNMKKTT